MLLVLLTVLAALLALLGYSLGIDCRNLNCSLWLRWLLCLTAAATVQLAALLIYNTVPFLTIVSPAFSLALLAGMFWGEPPS